MRVEEFKDLMGVKFDHLIRSQVVIQLLIQVVVLDT